MHSIWQDLRYAVRSLVKRPGFSALAILTLALGIGVNTVAFSAVNALLLRPLKLEDADRLGWIMLPRPGNPYGHATTEEFETLRRAPRALDAIEAEARVPVSLRTAAGAEQSWALLVSDRYLHTFNAPFDLGRPFEASDLESGALAAVVSHRFWKDQLGKPSSLAGTTIVLSGRVVSVVGVVSDSFQGPGGLYAPDIWLPLSRMEVLQLDPRTSDGEWLTLFGRLREPGTKAAAEAELTSFVRLVTNEQKDAERARGVFHVMREGHPELKEIGPFAWLALGAVNVVLLIACFNLSSLLFARAAERQSEIAVRGALGATRWRILQQLVTESFVLAVVAGGASLVLAAWTGPLLATFSLPAPIPQRLHFNVDWFLIAFTVIATVVAGMVPAALPGWLGSRASLTSRMREGATSRSRVRNAFVIAQIAGSTAFVIAAALFVRSFLHSAAVDPGFDSSHIALLRVAPTSHGYSPEESRTLLQSLEERARALPGVRDVALSAHAPFALSAPETVEYSAGADDCRAAECPTALVVRVGARHFSALGLPIRAGREFTPADRHASPRIIISEQLAARLWPGEQATGRSLRLGENGEIAEVIGVADNVRHRNFGDRQAAYIYRPVQDTDYAAGLSLLVRTHGDPSAVLTTLREQLRALDPDIPPASLGTMEEQMKLPLWPARTAAGFFLICGTLALALATIGLFGVMYFTVAQRTREFGIRVAIGATSGRVLRVVLGEGLRLALPGVALGMAAGYIVGRVLSRALYEVTAADPVSLGGGAAIQLLVALAACLLPAYRATRADPISALRHD